MSKPKPLYLTRHLDGDTRGYDALTDALVDADANCGTVYERFGNHTSVTLDHNERMLAALKRCATWTATCASPNYGLAAEARELIAQVEQYNAAQLAAMERLES